MSSFIDTKDLIQKLVEKAGLDRALLVEKWLEKHIYHKPGPEILHDQHSMVLTAKCHGCKETVDFKFKVPPLDQI